MHCHFKICSDVCKLLYFLLSFNCVSMFSDLQFITAPMVICVFCVQRIATLLLVCLRFLVSSFIAASLFVYVFRLSGRWEYVGPLFVGRWWNQLTLCSLVDAAVMCCLSPHLFCLFPRSLSMQSQRHSHFQDMFTRIPFSIGLLTFCLVVCARLWVRICPPQAMLF